MLGDGSPEWEDKAVQRAVVTAVDRMLACGIVHNDLKREHMGLYTIDGVVHAAFIDLSDM